MQCIGSASNQEKTHLGDGLVDVAPSHRASAFAQTPGDEGVPRDHASGGVHPPSPARSLTGPAIDVYRGFEYSALRLCGHLSAESGGDAVEVPDFRPE